MPIYEYDCKVCHKPFEKLVRSSSDTSSVKCPACGSAKTARLPSTFAAVAGNKSVSTPMPQGGCGRCGAPGPCPNG